MVAKLLNPGPDLFWIAINLDLVVEIPHHIFDQVCVGEFHGITLRLVVWW
jgi:hypothetical protein